MNVLLDTVTLSELRKGPQHIDPRVADWQQSIGDAEVFVSVITFNEIRYGILKIERKDPDFAKLLKRWYALLFSRSVRLIPLGVDVSIAESAAELRYEHSMTYNDALIAATAKVRSLTLVTRNSSDFEATKIQLINPWNETR